MNNPNTQQMITTNHGQALQPTQKLTANVNSALHWLQKSLPWLLVSNNSPFVDCVSHGFQLGVECDLVQNLKLLGRYWEDL